MSSIERKYYDAILNIKPWYASDIQEFVGGLKQQNEKMLKYMVKVYKILFTKDETDSLLKSEIENIIKEVTGKSISEGIE